MSEYSCEYWFEHKSVANEVCGHCDLLVDEHGNTEADFRTYCSFPDCGCDGARLCQSIEGPNDDANVGNVEGMWLAKKPTKAQIKGRLETYAISKGLNKSLSNGDSHEE